MHNLNDSYCVFDGLCNSHVLAGLNLNDRGDLYVRDNINPYDFGSAMLKANKMKLTLADIYGRCAVGEKSKTIQSSINK